VNTKGSLVNNLRKSSDSTNDDGQCVEVGSYRKSRRSTIDTHCVEVGAGDQVGVRDTKAAGDADRVELRFSACSWESFLRQLKTRA
jgi:hypothetical protein